MSALFTLRALLPSRIWLATSSLPLTLLACTRSSIRLRNWTAIGLSTGNWLIVAWIWLAVYEAGLAKILLAFCSGVALESNDLIFIGFTFLSFNNWLALLISLKSFLASSGFEISTSKVLATISVNSFTDLGLSFVWVSTALTKLCWLSVILDESVLLQSSSWSV